MGAMEDFYLSRITSSPALLPRQEPVVYGDVDPAVLSAGQVRHYEDNGFLFFEEFFSSGELARLQAELERLRQDETLKEQPVSITEPSSGEIRSIFSVHTLSEVFSLLSRDSRLLNLVRQLLGSEVYIHQSRVNCKPGFDGKEFYWHSDFETWHAEDGMPRMRAISCSVSLTDNHPFNGPLMVVPGSHRWFVQCQGETPEDNFKSSLKKQEIGVPSREHLQRLVGDGGIAMPVGRAGSVLFFECNVMHGSNGNITPYPRSNAFFVFNSVENSLVEPFAAAKRRPDFLGSRDFTPLIPSEFSATGAVRQPASLQSQVQ